MSEKKIAIFIPIKSNSTRIPNKNFTDVGGLPLYAWSFRVGCGLNAYENIDVYVDTDCKDEKFLNWANSMGITNIIERQPELSKDTASGDDLLKYHINKFPDYDIYCQLYITCPFQNPESIIDCIAACNKEYDSSFTAHENYNWYWYDGKPVNYTPGKLLRSQDAKPVINETTGFYAITKKAWEKTQCRIGENPYMKMVSFIESIDIDNEEDLELARIIAKNEI